MGPGVHVPLRLLRVILKKGAAVIRSRIAAAQTSGSHQLVKDLQLFCARARAGRSIDRLQSSKLYSTHFGSLKRSFGTTSTPKYARSSSKIISAVGRLTTHSPFASTLRPKLSGALPRTASGYSLGGGGIGGPRFFCHSPAAPAQVIHQVSAAMRCFALKGSNSIKNEHHLRHNGASARVGVRAQLAAALCENGAAPGAFVDFNLSPTITTLSRFTNKSLEAPNLMEDLSSDFNTMISEIGVVYSDLQKLASLGDMPISLARNNEDTIRVHFCGHEKEFVQRLCEDLGVRRGVVGEDSRFGFELLMPTLDMAPCITNHRKRDVVDWRDMLTISNITSPGDTGIVVHDYHQDSGQNGYYTHDDGEEASSWTPGAFTPSSSSVDGGGFGDLLQSSPVVYSSEEDYRSQMWG